jgi:hypothetical protein
LFQPRGGRFLYGLLGAEVDINLENCEIILDLMNRNLENRLFQSDFLNELDEAKYGLPIEYATELQKFRGCSRLAEVLLYENEDKSL